MAYQNLSVFLRNDSVGTITMGTLSIGAGNSAQIWDTVDYTSGVIDNFAQVVAGIAVFNENIGTSDLVMVVNTVDQTTQDAFDQFQELLDVYNELDLAERGFAALRLDSEETQGLIIDHEDLINNDLNVHPQYVSTDGTNPLQADLDLDGYEITVGNGVEIGNAYEKTKEPTGFPNRTDSQFSFNDGTRTFTVEPVSGSFEYLYRGKPIIISSQKTIVWSDVEGIHGFALDSNGDLIHTTDGDTIGSWILGDAAFISAIYWDATNNESILRVEERHGFMPGDVHWEFHQAFGAQWISGGDLTDIVIGDGSSNTHAQLGVSDVSIADEDIRLTFTDGSPQGLSAPINGPVFYRSGSNGDWRRKTPDDYPMIYTGTAGYSGTRIPYNADASDVGITFVGSEENSVTATSITLNVPTGVQDDDVLIAIICHAESEDNTFTTPTGWTLVVNELQTGGFSPSVPGTSVYIRVASSEPASYSFNGTFSSGIVGTMLAYRNVDTTTPQDATATTISDFGTEPDPPSITTVSDNALVITIGFKDDGGEPITDTSAGYVQRSIQSNASGGNGCSLGVCENEVLDPGAENPDPFTSGVDEWAGITLALRPAAAGATDWQLLESGEDTYVLLHAFANNSVSEPICFIQGQAQYDSLEEASTGATTEINTLKGIIRLLGPEFVALGTLIIQTSSSYSNTPNARFVRSNSGAKYIDQRGNTSTGFGNIGGGGVTVHGDLDGLNVDDHPQYFLTDGNRIMTGNLNLGGNTVLGFGSDLDLDGYSIVDVGTVDGVDVSSHADRHILGGADEIDGDELDIDYTPSNYTPATGSPGSNVNHLAAHLRGIDNAITGGTGDVVGPGSATDNAIARFDGTTGKLIQDSGVTVDDSNNIAGASSIAIGSNPASQGDFRADDGFTMFWNDAGTDRRAFNGVGDTLFIGQDGTPGTVATIEIEASTSYAFDIGSTRVADVVETEWDFNIPVNMNGNNIITGAGTVDGRDVSADGTTLDNHVAATNNPHSTDIGNLGSGSLAELNSIITDATLDDSGDQRTPTSHASTHISAGSDEIDGDQLDIDWNPSNYTPATTPTEVTSVDHLTAHLYGIDQELAGFGDVSGPGSSTDNALVRWDGTSGNTIQNSGWVLGDIDTLTAAGTLAMGSNPITTSSTVDGRNVSADGTTLDNHVANTSNPHSTDIGNLGSGTLAELNTVITDATLGGLTSTAPVNVERNTAQVGTSSEVARADHRHDIETALPSALTVGQSGSEGISNSLARADHDHQVVAGTPVDIGDANATGSLNSFVRSDHVHALGGSVGGDLSGTLPNPTVTDLTISGEEEGSILYFDGINWVQLPPGDDGYVLQSNGDGYAPSWVANYEAVVDVYDTTGGTTFDTTPVYVPFDTQRRINSDVYSHDTATSNSEVTVNEEGAYRITAQVGSNILSGNNRSASAMWVELDDGGGGFSEIAGTRGIMYNREISEGGTHATRVFYANLTAGSKLRVGVQRISGSNTIALQADNSSLVIEKQGGVQTITVNTSAPTSPTTPNTNSIAIWGDSSGNTLEDTNVFISSDDIITGVNYIEADAGSGATLATTGAIRLTNDNSGGIAFHSDNAQIYYGSGQSRLRINASRVNIQSTDMQLDASDVFFIENATSPTIRQEDEDDSVSAQNLTIQAQNNTFGSSTGGSLILTSGTGTSSSGDVAVQVGGVDAMKFDDNTASTISDGFLVAYNATNDAVEYIDPSTVGGSGDVSGPASSTDNAIARFNGTTGKIIQNSGVTIDDSGNMDLGGGNITTTGTIDGINVSGHSTRHISGGGDEIDGDQLDIDWNPSNYTPTTSPTQVTSIEHLTAHLAGIDAALGSGGEANTASNQGTGIGVFDNKDGVDLEFRSLVSANDRLSITLDGPNLEIDFTLNESNIVHQNLSGAGTNTHAQIDTHIADTNNPHSTDIGNLGSGTLAELNSIVTDATLDDSSDSRPPSGSAGGDLFGTYPNPQVIDLSIAGESQGSVLYFDGLSWVQLAPGTSGEFLQTQGTAANPQWATPSGSGDVTGPASSTDNAIARFDGTTGKIIQNSGVTIDNDGNIFLDTNGSNTSNPRVFGANNFTTSEAIAWQFGDDSNAIQNSWGGSMTLYAYHTIVLRGDRDTSGNPGFDTESGIGVWIPNTTASSPALVVDGAGSQTADLQQWRDSTPNTLLSVDSSGNIVMAGAQTVDGRDVSADGSTLDSHVANTSNPHSTDIGNLGSGTLAELNAAVSDATLDDSSDSRTPTTHASTHISAGSDEIDGDQLDIDWNPSNYTPSTSPTEVSSVDHLTAHLAGIDSFVGTASSHISSSSNPHNTTLAILNDTNIASPAWGELLYRGSTLWQQLAVGTAGQVLSTNGSNAAPSWVNAGGLDGDAIHDNVSGEINGITEKASPVSADLLIIEDSEASNAKKKVQIGNLPSGGSAGIQSYSIGLTDDLAVNVEQNNALWGALVIPLVDVTVQTMKCQVTQSSASGSVYFAIYDSSFTKLGDETTGVSCSTTGIKSATLSSSVSLTAGNVYYLCLRSDSLGSRFAGTSCTANTASPQYSIRKDGAATAMFPSSFSLPASNSSILWIQATE